MFKFWDEGEKERKNEKRKYLGEEFGGRHWVPRADTGRTHVHLLSQTDKKKDIRTKFGDSIGDALNTPSILCFGLQIHRRRQGAEHHQERSGTGRQKLKPIDDGVVREGEVGGTLGLGTGAAVGFAKFMETLADQGRPSGSNARHHAASEDRHEAGPGHQRRAGKIRGPVRNCNWGPSTSLEN